MIDVHEAISGIVMFCDESLLAVNIGNGYSFKKNRFEDLPFKDKIIDGQGRIASAYFMSRLIENGVTSFICIEKDGLFQINGPIITGKTQQFTDKEMMCEDEINHHQQEEMEYLNMMVDLLHVFKMGNIGFHDIFTTYQFTVLGIINNTTNHNNFYASRNIVDSRKYTLSPEEAILCNQFLNDYSGAVYTLLANCIKEFSWGLEQLDIATSFEQFTTALEMTLLEHNQQAKKQTLANRVSSMIGKNNSEIQQIHQKMLDFYRFRSESLHEGDSSNISENDVRDLEEIVRLVLKDCLQRCRQEYTANQSITWTEIKTSMINDLKTIVGGLQSQGVI